MDVMQLRRRLMAQTTKIKKDMLGNVVWVIGSYLNDNESVNQHGSARYTETYIPVNPNEQYILTGHSQTSPLWDRIHAYNENKEWLRQLSKLDWYGDFTSIIVIPNDCYYVRISTEIESITQVHMYVD